VLLKRGSEWSGMMVRMGKAGTESSLQKQNRYAIGVVIKRI
jgi:hypothetical protein